MSSSEESDQPVRHVRRKKRDEMDTQYKPKEDLKVPKKPKPLGAPKRPKSAYTLFVAAKYKAIKDDNPEMKHKEIFKECAAAWKEADDDAKKEFDDEAKKEKEDYEEKNQKYRASARFKRYKRDLKDWNELYRDEYEEEKFEKEQKKKERAKEPKKKTTSPPKKRGRKKKQK